MKCQTPYCRIVYQANEAKTDRAATEELSQRVKTVHR